LGEDMNNSLQLAHPVQLYLLIFVNTGSVSKTKHNLTYVS